MKFDLGDYIYYVNHDTETIDRYRVASCYIVNGETRYLLVGQGISTTLTYWEIVDNFMSAHQIYEYVIGLSAIESIA